MDIFSSRYFIHSDLFMEKFDWDGVSFDFCKMGWWSRIYEYEWMKNVCTSYFSDISEKSVVDIATGDQHPCMFILKSLGFLRVVGPDILPLDKLKHCSFVKNGIEYVQDDVCTTKIKDRFDCVSCISVLEHLDPKRQIIALENIINMTKDNGCIVLTFDMPGYEYSTSIETYGKILQSRGFYFLNQHVEDNKKIMTTNSPIACLNLRQMNLSCYRIFASRKPLC